MQHCELARNRVTSIYSSSCLSGHVEFRVDFGVKVVSHMQMPLHYRKKPQTTKTETKNPKNTEEKTRGEKKNPNLQPRKPTQPPLKLASQP